MDIKGVAIILLYFLCQTCSVLSTDLMKKPLVFHYLHRDPQKVYIYFDPLVSISQVTLLSTQDVQYTRNASSAELKEDFGPTHQLVGESDNDDGTKRYVFVKKSLCHEVDWTVAWLDKDGVPHGPATQRLGPSPVPWRPKVALRISPPLLNGSSVLVNLNYELNDVQLNKREFIVEPVMPYIDLQECKYNFKKTQMRPQVLNSKSLSIPTAYVLNECTFWVRLQLTVYDEDMGCRISRTTLLDENIDGTDKLKLRCDKVTGLDCPPTSSPQPCDMDCMPNYFARPVYDYSTPRPSPVARLSFSPPQKTDKEMTGWIMRHVQIDRSHFNYPLKEFNVTVQTIPKHVMHKDFEPYSKDIGVSYGVQTCALYKSCPAEAAPNWAYVPQISIFYNQLFENMPPPTTSTTSTTSTTKQWSTVSNTKTPLIPKQSYTNRPVIQREMPIQTPKVTNYATENIDTEQAKRPPDEGRPRVDQHRATSANNAAVSRCNPPITLYVIVLCVIHCLSAYILQMKILYRYDTY